MDGTDDKTIEEEDKQQVSRRAPVDDTEDTNLLPEQISPSPPLQDNEGDTATTQQGVGLRTDSMGVCSELEGVEDSPREDNDGTAVNVEDQAPSAPLAELPASSEMDNDAVISCEADASLLSNNPSGAGRSSCSNAVQESELSNVPSGGARRSSCSNAVQESELPNVPSGGARRSSCSNAVQESEVLNVPSGGTRRSSCSDAIQEKAVCQAKSLQVWWGVPFQSVSKETLGTNPEQTQVEDSTTEGSVDSSDLGGSISKCMLPCPSKMSHMDRLSSLVSDHTRALTPTSSVGDLEAPETLPAESQETAVRPSLLRARLQSFFQPSSGDSRVRVGIQIDGDENVEVITEQSYASKVVGRRRLIMCLLSALFAIIFIGITGGVVSSKKKGAVAGAEEDINAAPECAPAYVEGQTYQTGEQVSSHGKNYACKEEPYAGFCSQAAWAFEPGIGAEWMSAWDLVQDCEVMSSVRVCAPAYEKGGAYSPGQQVSNDSKNYECKDRPFGEMCSKDPWAYEPGKGIKWDLAWRVIEDCVKNPPAAPMPTPPVPPTHAAPPQAAPTQAAPTQAAAPAQAAPTQEAAPTQAAPTQAAAPTQPTVSMPSTIVGSAPSKPTRPISNTKKPGQKTIIGYYASWQWYDRERLASPENMDFTKLHRVNFAFFQTDVDGNIFGTDSWADPQVLFGPTNWNAKPDDAKYCSWDGPDTKNCNAHHHEEGLIGRAHAAGAEVYPSIGGWTLSDAFPAMAATSAGRQNFANKCVELIMDYDFDGIDIDWEYPGYAEHSGTPADKANFNLLLDEIRSKLDAHSLVTGKDYGLTAALPCGPEKMKDIDIPHVSRSLTELNLMTYDFHGAWDETTGVNAPMHAQGWGPTDFDLDSCVKNWIAGGGSRSSINIGLAFYGRSFKGASGLNQQHGGADTFNWQADEGSPQYYNIVAKLPSMTTVRDDTTETQYAYFNNGGMVSYDDERAICDKTDYVLQNNLNGFIIWEVSGDLMPDLTTPLLDTVNVKLADPTFDCGSPLPVVVPPAYGLPPTAAPLSPPTLSPIPVPSSSSVFLPFHPVPDTHQKTANPTGRAVEAILEASKENINNKLFLYQTPRNSWEPSAVYRYSGFIAGLRVMYQSGVASKFFYMGDSSASGHLYGLVNIAAFLAQSMKETIKYDACDENSWDLVNGRYPLSNACGQLGQSYQDYHCSPDEAYMECKVDPNMQITAVTNAKWYGAPGPLKCGPKSVYPFTGSWEYSKECNKPWASPPEICSDYEGQLAGGENNNAPVANVNGRTDVEGCCYWGRGVIQTTGICNFGKLNYFLGKRAADEGRPSRYPTIDFCADPEAICASEEFKELKWIAGFFYWMESVQTYNQGGWHYMTKLHEFVDGNFKDLSFIDSVSGIVNRGCHNPPCGTGALDGGPERKDNFQKVLREFGLL